MRPGYPSPPGSPWPCGHFLAVRLGQLCRECGTALCPGLRDWPRGWDAKAPGPVRAGSERPGEAPCPAQDPDRGVSLLAPSDLAGESRGGVRCGGSWRPRWPSWPEDSGSSGLMSQRARLTPEPCCCFAELSACDVGVCALPGERVSLGDGLLTLRGRLGKHRSSGAPPVPGFAAVGVVGSDLPVAVTCSPSDFSFK